MAGKDMQDFGREARETVVKSSLTGVGLTVLAVAALSPAGFGGMIGSSVASALGNDHATSAKPDPFANLPPYPTLLTNNEIDDIRSQLAATNASMEITRAATDDRIELVRELASSPTALSVAPTRHLVKSHTVARSPQPQAAASAPVQSAPVASAQTSASSVTMATPAQATPAQATPAQETAAPQQVMAATPIAPISFDDSRFDSHLELASLFLGEN